MGVKHHKVREPCFNVIFEDENITIPEIDDTDFLNFGLVFMKIKERETSQNNSDKSRSASSTKLNASPISAPAHALKIVRF